MIGVIYVLLKKDRELLSHLTPGTEPPGPGLYDPQVHRQHRLGKYQPTQLKEKSAKLIQLPSL